MEKRSQREVQRQSGPLAPLYTTDSWMASVIESVEHLTLNFSSGHNLKVMGSSPDGLHAQWGVYFVSFSLCLLSLSLSLKQILKTSKRMTDTNVYSTPKAKKKPLAAKQTTTEGKGSQKKIPNPLPLPHHCGRICKSWHINKDIVFKFLQMKDKQGKRLPSRAYRGF